MRVPVAVRSLALAALLLTEACGGGSGGGASPTPPGGGGGGGGGGGATGRYAVLADALDGAVSPYFGITASREAKDAAFTYYRVPAPTGDNADDLVQPWFDVGNNDLLVELDANGLMEYPIVCGALAGFATGTGVGPSPYGDRDFLAGRPWSFSIADGVHAATSLPTLPGTSVELVDGHWFRWTYATSGLTVEVLPFAPEAAGAAANPRGLVVLVRVTNRGASPFAGTLELPAGVRDADHLDATATPASIYGPAPAPIAGNHHGDTRNYVPRFAEVGPAVAGYDAAAALGDTTFVPGTTSVALSLAPGASAVSTVGLIVGGGVAELLHTRDVLRSKSPLAWINATEAARAARVGSLSIPAAPYVAELFGRHVAVAQDAYLRTGTGRMTSPHSGSWLLMSRVAPEFLAATIPGGDLGLSCPMTAAGYSLYGSTFTSVVAGLCWRATGDPTLFADRAAFETQTHCLLDALDAVKHSGVALYPSVRIWDGPSRGDYHTGSNILAWYAYRSAARFASELWGDASSAQTWAAKADATKAAIESRCVVAGRFGPQYAEGTFASGRVDAEVLCHDGEEVAVATSPLLGFTAADDPLVTNHGAAALTDQNVFYNAALDGMYWTTGAPITSPGVIVGLSGAAGPSGVRRAIDRWRRLTDVDGSVYWWHYDNPGNDPTRIRRRYNVSTGGGIIDTAKCDYATSNFAALLVHDVIGLDADVPARTASFRPAPPWPAFHWTKARAGNAFFDLDYADDGATVTATLVNRNSVAYDVEVEVVVPAGKVAWGTVATSWRYGRDARRASGPVAPGDSLSASIPYSDPVEAAGVAAAWNASVVAHDSNPSGSFANDGAADLDGNGLPEAYEWRLLAEARVADPAVEAAWQANQALGASLGWGDWWGTICADYATVSSALADVVNQWCVPKLAFVPFRAAGLETLAARRDFDGDGRTNEAEFVAVGATAATPPAYGHAAVTKRP